MRIQHHANHHYSDAIMSAMASQITGVPIVFSTVCSGADQRKNQSFASLAFVRGIHRWPVNSPHKGPVTRKMFPFDDVIMVAIHSVHSKVMVRTPKFCLVSLSWIAPKLGTSMYLVLKVGGIHDHDTFGAISVSFSALRHYPNELWLIINFTKWNLNQDKYFF